MKIIPKIGFCAIYHPFEENAENAPKIFESSITVLQSIDDIEIIIADELIKDNNSAISVANQFKDAGVDVICLRIATWSSDNPLLDMSSILDVPFIFWTYSHMHSGSMCGGQQFNMIFKELKKQCSFVHGDDNHALEKIKQYSKCTALIKKLKTLKLLKIGHRTQGMAEVICDEFSIKEIFGPRIVSIDFDYINQYTKRNIENEAIIRWEQLKEKVGKVSVKESDGLTAVKTYLALKEIIEEEKLSGITVECYPHHMGEFCLAFSLLAEEGIPGSCEGDLNSLILMYILMKLSGTPVHDIDQLYLYEEDNSVIGSHCGSGSLKLASSMEEIELANVRLAKKGLCVLFPSKPGKVTMANLVGRKGTYRMGIIEGNAIQTDMVFPGNPIRIQLPISIRQYLDVIEEFGLGHHWIIAYGNHSRSLKLMASILGINCIEFQ